MPPSSTADARLAALEARTRRLTAGWIAALAVGGLAAFGARPSAQEPASPGQAVDVVRARRIELVDDEGRVRAALAIDAEGSAGLFVRDAEGRLRASVTHDEAQSALFLYDGEGQVRVGAAQFAHGGGGYALHGPGGEGAAVLYLKGQGNLTFYDADGGVRARLPE